MSRAECSIPERLDAALAEAPTESVAALCRRVGISRQTLYRYYPAALDAIRQRQRPAPSAGAQDPTIRQLRAELACAHTLSQRFAALVDHYWSAYRETRELLDRRERELAELRRSRGSLPTRLRR